MPQGPTAHQVRLYARNSVGGETIGLAPGAMSRINAATAAACGLLHARRCPVTAIRMCVGRHPEVLVVERIIASFLHFLRGLFVFDWVGLRHAWLVIHDRAVVNGKVRWACVNGPSSALIAARTQYGWDCHQAVRWWMPAGLQSSYEGRLVVVDLCEER